MSGLCGCLGSEKKKTCTSLDAPIELNGNCGVSSTKKSTPTIKVLTYPLYGARGPNFDFVSTDNGENYVATFRAMLDGEVLGCDSKPIPRAVFEKFQILRKEKRGTCYCIDIDSGGVDPFIYFRVIDEETARKLGVTLE